MAVDAWRLACRSGALTSGHQGAEKGKEGGKMSGGGEVVKATAVLRQCFAHQHFKMSKKVPFWGRWIKTDFLLIQT